MFCLFSVAFSWPDFGPKLMHSYYVSNVKVCALPRSTPLWARFHLDARIVFPIIWRHGEWDISFFFCFSCQHIMGKVSLEQTANSIPTILISFFRCVSTHLHPTTKKFPPSLSIENQLVNRLEQLAVPTSSWLNIVKNLVSCHTAQSTKDAGMSSGTAYPSRLLPTSPCWTILLNGRPGKLSSSASSNAI